MFLIVIALCLPNKPPWVDDSYVWRRALKFSHIKTPSMFPNYKINKFQIIIAQIEDLVKIELKFHFSIFYIFRENIKDFFILFIFSDIRDVNKTVCIGNFRTN